MLFLLSNFWIIGFWEKLSSRVVSLLVLFSLVIAMSGLACAGEISILAPFETESMLLSRNKIVHVVVKVVDPGDLDKLHLYSEKSDRSYNSEGRYEKHGIYYVHYSLHLKKGNNSFVLGPANLPLTSFLVL